MQSWLHSSYTSVEMVSQAQELFPQQQSQPHSRAAGNAHTQKLITDMQAYSASVWVGISSVVSHLPDKSSSQNSAPSLLGPLWTFSSFYVYLGINLERVEAARERTEFYGPQSEDSIGMWETSVQAVWIKVAFPTLRMEELNVCANNYNILSNLFCNVKSIWCILFFLLPVWLVISFSFSLWVSKTIFCFSF